jgi:hypothetical protein
MTGARHYRDVFLIRIAIPGFGQENSFLKVAIRAGLCATRLVAKFNLLNKIMALERIIKLKIAEYYDDTGFDR